MKGRALERWTEVLIRVKVLISIFIKKHAVSNLHNGFLRSLRVKLFQAAEQKFEVYAFVHMRQSGKNRGAVVSLSRLLWKSTSGSWRTFNQRSGPWSVAEESRIQRKKQQSIHGSSQDANLIHCYESPHSIVCIYKVSLISLYTIIPITIVRILYTSGTTAPRKMNITIDAPKVTISNSFCSCKAGWVF